MPEVRLHVMRAEVLLIAPFGGRASNVLAHARVELGNLTKALANLPGALVIEHV